MIWHIAVGWVGASVGAALGWYMGRLVGYAHGWHCGQMAENERLLGCIDDVKAER